MRVVLQRVSRAAVRVDGQTVGAIGRGFVVLAGFAPADGEAALSWMAEKIAGLRVFADRDGKMNLPLADVGGAVLAISQFTLYGDAAKGRRPSFTGAAPPAIAEGLYGRFVELLRQRRVPVETGRFGAAMEVELVNDGPVTLVIERA
ncbi:MAG TPA: D-aminoacyl-tRNA deacylase [Gemmatimonadales bacterium]|nr:D-aminoacyl-tRNA deacylase [Gemmatimonadales bacterium]